MGRCAGLGPARTAGTFDTPTVLRQLQALVPSTWSLETIRWYDGAPFPEEPPELSALRSHPGVTLVVLPLRGGRQRHVEAAVLRDALDVVAHTGIERLYLAGDPRRHALTVQSARDSGCDIEIIGVSDGEQTPGDRIWLRRPEVLGALIGSGRGRRTSAASRGAYQSPGLHRTPVRLPVPDRPVPPSAP